MDTRDSRLVGDEVKVTNMLVGDIHRIWLYAEQGFAAPQPVTREAVTAYEGLVEGGYTSRLMAP